MTGAKSMEWRNHCHLWLLMYWQSRSIMLLFPIKKGEEQILPAWDCGCCNRQVHTSWWCICLMERKKLKDRIQHPHQVDGKGRDALIYTYEPFFCKCRGCRQYFLWVFRRSTERYRLKLKLLWSMTVKSGYLKSLQNKSNTEYAVAFQVSIEKHSKAIMLSFFKTWKKRMQSLKEYSKKKKILLCLTHCFGVYKHCKFH